MGRRSVLVVLVTLAVARARRLRPRRRHVVHAAQHGRPVPDEAAAGLRRRPRRCSRVVLDGAARAACKLGISRESLVLALGDPAHPRGRSARTARRRSPRACAARSPTARSTPALDDLAGGLLDIVSVPEIVDEVLATKPPCSILAFPKTDATSAVVARLLVDAARRAACARSEPLATYLAALEPGRGARSGRRRERSATASARASTPPRATSVIDPALGVVLDEGARALDPVKLVTLLRDGADACQPLTWLKPSGPRPDRRAARAAHVRRGRVRAEDAGRAAGVGRSPTTIRWPPWPRPRASTRPAPSRRSGPASRPRPTGCEKDGVLPSTGADAIKALSRVVPADRLLLAIQGADDAVRAAHLAAHQRRAGDGGASWSCTASSGAACESGLSVLAVAEALTGDAPPAALEEPLRQGLLAGRRRRREGGRDRQRSARSRCGRRSATCRSTTRSGSSATGCRRSARRRAASATAPASDSSRKSTTLDQRRAGARSSRRRAASAASRRRPWRGRAARRACAAARCVNHATIAPDQAGAEQRRGGQHA